MPVASGYSIQRNEIINLDHRQNREEHTGSSTTVVFFLRSLPDYSDRAWNWDIRVGGVKFSINRKTGVNSESTYVASDNKGAATTTSDGSTLLSSLTDAQIFEERPQDVYSEGVLDAGYGAVRYRQDLGTFGAIEFDPAYAPPDAAKVEITYREHYTQWTGLNGGLMYQLARDMCVHPYSSPELLRVSTALPLSAIDVPATDTPTQVVPITSGDPNPVVVMRLKSSIRFNTDYAETDQQTTQRQGKRVYKIVRQFKATSSVKDITYGSTGADNDRVDGNYVYTTGTDPIGPTKQLTISTLTNGLEAQAEKIATKFPFTKRDLGSGEFRVAINNRVIRDDQFVVVSDLKTRTSRIDLVVDSADFNWVSDTTNVNITISYNWGPSLEVPYGALVGKNGLAPYSHGTDTNALTSGWNYVPAAASGNANIDLTIASNTGATVNGNPDLLDVNGTTFGGHVEDITTATGGLNHVASVTIDGQSSFRMIGPAFIGYGDLLLLQFDEEAAYKPAFQLVNPKPVSNTENDVLDALSQITDRFLVESSAGCDLNSDPELVTISYDPSSNKVTPQTFRVRMEYLPSTSELKVNVATEYQLRDDMSITQGQSRDGAKYPIFREPGELCDVYEAPAIGRGATYKLTKGKSQWFRRSMKTDDVVSRTYPMSYRISTTNHGFGLFVFDQASVDQDDDYAWLVVQRHVDQTTGQPEFTGKSPVHCVYSPVKRPVELADLNAYYSSGDVADLTKAPNLYGTFGDELETEAPTIFIDQTESLFSGTVNSIDLTGDGYRSPDAPQGQPLGALGELDVGWLGGAGATDAEMADYWALDPASAGPSFRVSELEIQGFNALPRDANGATATLVGNNIASNAIWLNPASTEVATSVSGNQVFQKLRLNRVSTFVAASVSGTGLFNTAAAGFGGLGDWLDPSYALLDILYTEIPENKEKVLESLLVALDGVQVPLSQGAYILTYDEWVRDGDPLTSGRFIEGLDLAGAGQLGSKFRLPDDAVSTSTGGTIGAATDMGTAGTALGALTTASINTTTGQAFGDHLGTAPYTGSANTGVLITALQALDPQDVFVLSTQKDALKGKLPGDVIWPEQGGPNVFMYDYFNQTLFFRDSPRPSASLTIKLINYNQGNPSANVYVISVPPDRDFPERNLGKIKAINRFVVREADVFKPWDYHVSATMHEKDSNAIINPREQLSITQNRDFVFSFPTQLTSQRFYYPRSELDMIAVSSADFSTQSGHIEIDKYSDSNALNIAKLSITVGGTAHDFEPVTGATDSEGASIFEYGGHVGPDNSKYYWQRNKRKYEGMMSTESFGNGMRVFLQVTGSSIRFSDVVDGTAPSANGE